MCLALQIDLFLNSCLAEHVMTTADTHLKVENGEQVTKIVKLDIRIRSPTQYALKNLLPAHADILHGSRRVVDSTEIIQV